ncbi:MAG: hypothetical protein ABFD03_10425 [Clostridiaceae bacterium]
MKKFILTVALVLAVVTSLVAGTMAAYTQQLDTTSNAVTTKTFSINGSMSDSFNEAIEIAPGESVDYKIAITNDGEVSAKLDVEATIAAISGDEIDGLKFANVTVDQISIGDKSEKKVSLTTGEKADELLKPGETATIAFRVTWTYADDKDTNAQDNADMLKASSQLVVKVNAISLNNEAINEAGKVDTKFGN